MKAFTKEQTRQIRWRRTALVAFAIVVVAAGAGALRLTRPTTDDFRSYYSSQPHGGDTILIRVNNPVAPFFVSKFCIIIDPTVKPFKCYTGIIGRFYEEKGALARFWTIYFRTFDRQQPPSDAERHFFAAMDASDYETALSLVRQHPELHDVKTSTGRTPLHIAAIVGNTEVARLLISNGAKVNARDKDAVTPLMAAVLYFHGQKDTVELLLSKHADVNAKDRYGITPLQSALESHAQDLAALLRAHGGKVK